MRSSDWSSDVCTSDLCISPDKGIQENIMTTLCAAFQRVSAVAPDAVALRDIGDARTLTWRAYGEQVRDVAAGLAGIGVGHGDTVALMMSNRIEFYPIAVGAQNPGDTSFPIYPTSQPDPHH